MKFQSGAPIIKLVDFQMKNCALVLFFLFVSLSTLHSQTSGFPAAVEPDGQGSAGEPYQISSLENLLWMALNVSTNNDFFDFHFVQTDDIDASDSAEWDGGQGFPPIGGGGTGAKFKGFYDGQGHVITGLRINRPNTPNVGLFGHVGIAESNQSSEIKNLGLVDVVVAGARGTGTLIGRVTGNQATLVERCFAVDGSVTGDGATGGLIGSNNSYIGNPQNRDFNPRVIESFADIDVIFSGKVLDQANDKFGGLAGCNQKGNIINSYARGNVLTGSNSGTFRVGGLAGCIDNRGAISNSFSTGRVTGGDLVGGIIGNGGTGGGAGFIENSFWDIESSLMTDNSVEDEGAAEGKTTGQMQQLSTFYNAGWEFVDGDNDGPWNIGKGNDEGNNDAGNDDEVRNDGYPYFVWQFPDDPELRVWTGPDGGDWNTASNWTGGNVPTESDKVVIRSGDDAVLNTAIDGCVTLTVETDAAFTVDTDGSIGDCELIVNSGASLLNKAPIPGTNIRFERILTSPDFGAPLNGGTGNGGTVDGHWVALGSPVSNSQYAGPDGLLERVWTQGFPGADQPNVASNFSNVVEYRYVENDGDNALSGGWHPPESNNITPGRGFFVYLYENKFRDDPSTAVDFTQPFSVTGPVNEFTDANGSPGLFAFPELVYNGTDEDPDEGVFLSWNMLSNPFGAGLDWSATGGESWVKEDITEFAYIWDPAQAQYLVTSSDGGDLEVLTDPVIAPFQAFWVQATNGNSGDGSGDDPEPSLSVGPDAMTASTANSGFFKHAESAIAGNEVSSRSASTPGISLRLEAGGFTSQTGIRFGHQYAAGMNDLNEPVFTVRDAWFLTPMAYSYAWLHSVADGKPLVLKSLPLEFDGPIELPVEAGAMHGGLPVAGPAGISVTSMANIPVEWSVALRDNHTGAVIDLRATDRYDFDLSPDTHQKVVAQKEGSIPSGMHHAGLNPADPHSFKRMSRDRTQMSKAGTETARFSLLIAPDEGFFNEIRAELPERLELAQNFPNPFNPSTVIGYSLPEETRVRLSVYDLLGRRAAVLVDRQQEAGRHQVSWDASQFASGVYMYRLEVDGQSLTRRMTLVR
ncbi:MAG: T9SS C-terminal target domain-containing protein [Balneolaceae bacterium]|nr:MAG: T9SS C-terminal target domain-containing protein [Balneolaceae bacterium]